MRKIDANCRSKIYIWCAIYHFVNNTFILYHTAKPHYSKVFVGYKMNLHPCNDEIFLVLKMTKFIEKKLRKNQIYRVKFTNHGQYSRIKI